MSQSLDSVRAWWRSCVRWAVVAIVLGSAVAQAAPPAMNPSVPTCIPKDGNSVVSMVVNPETGWGSVRVYFRKAGSPDFYFLEMRSVGRGNYWAVLPRPEAGTTVADLQFAVRDGEGKETRSAVQQVSVTSNCPMSLSAEQETFARNLVVGETQVLQAGEVLQGWQCTGVVSRIGASGQMRYDDTCRSKVIAAAAGAAASSSLALWVPLGAAAGAAVGGAVIHQHEEPDCSKCLVTPPR